MLAALHESRMQQRQLVADASHELRTPLTSVRTNIEFLMRNDGLSEDERQETLRDVRTELDELTKIVRELVDLASERRPDAASFEDVRLDLLAASVAERATRRTRAVDRAARRADARRRELRPARARGREPRRERREVECGRLAD